MILDFSYTPLLESAISHLEVFIELIGAFLSFLHETMEDLQ